MGKIQAVVLGYGNRGASYSDYAVKHPDGLEIVAVADPTARPRKFRSTPLETPSQAATAAAMWAL